MKTLQPATQDQLDQIEQLIRTTSATHQELLEKEARGTMLSESEARFVNDVDTFTFDVDLPPRSETS